MATRFALSRLSITRSMASTWGTTTRYITDRSKVLNEAEWAEEKSYIQKMNRAIQRKLRKHGVKEPKVPKSSSRKKTEKSKIEDSPNNDNAAAM